MRLPDSRAELTTRRLLLVGAFALVSLVTMVAFAQAMTGHIAAIHAPSADVAVVDYEVTDDGSLAVTLRVHNPTIQDLELSNTRMNAYVDGEQVTDGTTASLDDAVVRSDETTTVTTTLGLREGGADRLRGADSEQVSMGGRLRAYVVDELVYVPVERMEVGG